MSAPDRVADRAPLYTAAYGLFIDLVREVRGWPTTAFELVGRHLVDHARVLLETGYSALVCPRDRPTQLARAGWAADGLRLALRAARDLGLLGDDRAAELIGRADELGCMVGGWQRALDENELDADGATTASSAAGRTGTTRTGFGLPIGTGGPRSTGTSASASSAPPPESACDEA